VGDFGHHTFLQALHFRGAGGCLVIVATEVEEAMRDIQTQLVFKRCPEGARLASRRLGADHDLAMLKRDDVCWATLIKKAAVKVCNSSVGYQNDVHFVELREAALFSRSKFQAFL
jgi:hypothetical protein